MASFTFPGNVKPHFDERNRIYELDSCSGFGKVTLVYKTIKAGSLIRFKVTTYVDSF